MADRGFERERTAQDSPKVPKGKNYLLVIGIDQYQYFRPLNNAVRDAKAIQEILVERFQFEPAHTRMLLNEEATRGNILDTLHEYEEILSPEDNFMLYFAGHGTRIGLI